MEYRNFTQFPSLAYEGVDQHNQEFHVAVLRMTLKIKPDNSLKFAVKQAPLVAVDEYYGEINKSSVRQESDLVQYKPKCDVIVIGSAYAPSGKPAPRFEAGISISGSVTLGKKLTITGPRYWEKHDSGWSLIEPTPITSLPLHYEYTYGGQCRIDNDDPAANQVEAKYHLTPDQRQQHPDGPELTPVAHTICETNPVGIGYAEEWYFKAKELTRIAAPQIESPMEPVREFGKQYLPQGMGVITKSWAPRRQLLGTVDEEFLQCEESLPEDFDFAIWNGAHPDMQIPYPNGNETIELTNLMHTSVLDKNGNSITRLLLPGYKPFLLVRLEKGQIFPVDFKIDTLIINTEEKNLTLVYRAVISKEHEVRVLEARMITKDEAERQDTIKKEIKDELDRRNKPVNRRDNG